MSKKNVAVGKKFCSRVSMRNGRLCSLPGTVQIHWQRPGFTMEDPIDASVGYFCQGHAAKIIEEELGGDFMDKIVSHRPYDGS